MRGKIAPVSLGACDSNGLSEGCLTTDDSGIVTFSGLWADEEILYRLTEVKAPAGYELLSEPVYVGTLPVTADPDKTELQPDEVIDGNSYYYTLPITVHNGEVYTLPMTGGRSLPLTFLGIFMILLAIFPIILYVKKRRTNI